VADKIYSDFLEKIKFSFLFFLSSHILYIPQSLLHYQNTNQCWRIHNPPLIHHHLIEAGKKSIEIPNAKCYDRDGRELRGLRKCVSTLKRRWGKAKSL
jgi:hypothetical protein